MAPHFLHKAAAISVADAIKPESHNCQATKHAEILQTKTLMAGTVLYRPPGMVPVPRTIRPSECLAYL